MLQQNSFFAIADSGTTRNFFTTDAPTINVQQAKNPITIRIPDGRQLNATHCCELNLPQLPPEARTGHIVPGMKGHSLVSLVQLARAGCSISINNDNMNITNQGQQVMSAIKCPKSGLWLLPLTNTHENNKTKKAHEEIAGNVYQTSTQAEWIQYLHQACFSPVKTTWIRAIKKGHFLSWPGLTVEAVNKHLTPSTATTKGHIHRNIKNV